MNPTRRHFLQTTLLGGAAGLVGCAAPASSRRSYLSGVLEVGEIPEADAFLTDVMFQAERDQAIGPPLAARAYAMGHLAGFLAVNGIQRTHRSPYPEIGVAPAGTSPEAAYVTAGLRAAGEALQMPMGLDRERYLKRLSASGEAIQQGRQWGEEVGRIVQKRRTIDGGHAERVGFYFDPAYEPRKTIDSWSSTGPFYRTEIGPRFETYERGLFPNLGNMDPFAIQSKTQFAAPPFPDIRSREFADQYAEVYELGGSRSRSRTDDQTEIAFFWEDGPRGGTVPAAWLHIAMRLALRDRSYDLHDRGRFLALMSVAMADAALSAWHSKYHYDILRPETAIRQGGEKLGNPDPRVKRDRRWTTLIPTPPFPAYVSGHSAFSGSAAEVLKLWFGTDHVPFQVKAIDLVNWPKQLSGATRSYTNFTTAADENGMSRIYGGVHWQHDNVEGLRMGRAVGKEVFTRFLSHV